MGGFRWMSVDGGGCAAPTLFRFLCLSRHSRGADVQGAGAQERDGERRGNVGARDSEWKKSAPIRGNK